METSHAPAGSASPLEQGAGRAATHARTLAERRRGGCREPASGRPDQEVEGGAGSAASGWSPPRQVGAGRARGGGGAADEGREAEPRWAGGQAGRRACGRGGGREAARAAGAEVGATAAGEAARPPGGLRRVPTRLPSGRAWTPRRRRRAVLQAEHLEKGARFQPALSFRPEVHTANFWVGGWGAGRCPVPPLGPEVFASECGVVGDPRRPLPPRAGVCPAFSNPAELESCAFCGVREAFSRSERCFGPFPGAPAEKPKDKGRQATRLQILGWKELGSGSLKIFSFSLSVSMPCET